MHPYWYMYVLAVATKCILVIDCRLWWHLFFQSCVAGTCMYNDTVFSLSYLECVYACM